MNELFGDRGRDTGSGRLAHEMQHHVERYEHAFYRPLVSNWQNYENWQIAGGRDATQRATDIWKKALKEYVEPAMDPAIREALDTYVEQRRTEIGSEEP